MAKHLLTALLIFAGLTALAVQDTSYVPPSEPDTSSGPSKPPINTLAGSKSNLKSISDGQGGTYLVWENNAYTYSDSSMTPDYKIYAQHISSSGSPLWGNGIRVTASSRQQDSHYIVSDGAGGIIISWNQFLYTNNTYQDDSYDIYAQHLNSDGTKLWGDTGIVVSNAPNGQYVYGMIPYGSSGAIVAWDGNGVRTAKIDGNGNIIGQPSVISDNPEAYLDNLLPGTGGTYTALYYIEELTPDSNTVTDYYIQRFDSNGNALFPSGPVKYLSLGEDAQDIGISQVEPDGNGGVFLLITNADDSDKLYLQHISATGSITVNSTYGAVVDDETGGTAFMLSDGSGGVVVAWIDSRSTAVNRSFKSNAISTLDSQTGLYAQRFNSSGTKLWTENVSLKTSGVSTSGNFTGTSDANGNFIFVFPGEIINGNSLYAQKLSSSGVLQWPATGVLIDDTPGSGFKENVTVSVFDNKVVVFWEGQTSTNPALFAQVINPDGTTLPVTLTEFNASFSNGRVYLSWKTANETNNDYFQVLKSDDGLKYTGLGKVAGNGTSSAANTYGYTDHHPVTSGDYLYYRLKQVDKNGNWQYSEIKPVKLPQLQASAISIYPNPTQDLVKINHRPGISGLSYKLLDLSGKVVIPNSLLPGTAEFSIAALNAGTYILELTKGREKVSKKIIKL